MIVENQYLIKKEFIKYSNFFRLIKFIIRILKKDFEHNTKINFFNRYIKITYPIKNNKNLKKNFDSFKKKIQIYYEFLLKIHLK